MKPEFTTSGATTAKPQLIQPDTWTAILTAAGDTFELPEGDAEFDGEFSVQLPKVGYPTRTIVERLRLRPGEKPNPTGRASLLIPPGITTRQPDGQPGVEYVPWTWHQGQTHITAGERFQFRIHHNGTVPLPLAVPSLRGRSLVDSIVEHVRVVRR